MHNAQCNSPGASVSLLPIVDNKDPDAASVFEPAALLREARRQKGLAAADVPLVCNLDPDGDIVRRLKKSTQAKRFEAWPCYPTDLYTFPLGEQTIGISYHYSAPDVFAEADRDIVALAMRALKEAGLR